jgi:hypothetical protein
MDPVTILEVIQMLHRRSGKKGGFSMLGIKNLFALIGLAVVVFVGAGWYLGWYKVAEQSDGQGHPQVKIQVNASQVTSDLHKAEQKVLEDLEKAKAVSTPASTSAPQPPATTNGTPSSPPPQWIQVQQPPVAPVPPPSVPQGDTWVFPPPKDLP